MKAKKEDFLMDNKVFLLIAAGTGLILMFPYMAMKFNWQIPDPGSQVYNGVNWSTGDFIAMGILISGMASMYVLAARNIQPEKRLIAGIGFALAFIYIWAELAVGIFTNFGS